MQGIRKGALVLVLAFHPTFAYTQTINVKVGVHKDLQGVITPQIVSNVLARAERLIADNGSHQPDVNCPINIKLSGNVAYDPNLPRDFASWSGYKNAKAFGYNLIFLPRISNCAGSGDALGCTWMGGGVATVLASSATNALVVGHELGHGRGLDDISVVNRIMEWVANPGNDTIDQKECDVYGGPSATIDPNSPEPKLPSPPTSDKLTINDLLQGKGFIHGVLAAYPSIVKRCNDDLSEVREALNQPDFERRKYAFWIIGRCGNVGDLKLWNSTLNSPVGTNLSILDAKQVAIINSGIMYARNNNPEAAQIFESYSSSIQLNPPSSAEAQDFIGVPVSLIDNTTYIASIKAKSIAGITTDLVDKKNGSLSGALNSPAETASQLQRVVQKSREGNLDDAIAAALQISF